ncbi:SGNH/GDSL hydrolase family protein [Bradyrhizobium sp.]|uniref:SGNH/GDSL hydrolase family protein n=1 Tax=Bradyrhizobium sp. TaxID=376 RepID=UPI003C747585
MKALATETQASSEERGAAVSLLCGLILSAVALVVYDRVKVDPTTFDLDPAMIEVAESWNGVTFTGSYPKAIQAMIMAQTAHPAPATGRCESLNILWLGNSQLHYIENFEKGQHAAPYILRSSLACPDTTVPLGVSLPHANLQEHYALAHLVQRRLPIKVLIVQLSFDDLREDGLRDDFGWLLDSDDLAALRKNPVGAAVLAKAELRWQGRDVGEENVALAGFLQKRLEEAVNLTLGEIWPLWADRKWLRSRLYIDLYGIRNAALGIRSTTTRRLIPQRYATNMAALRALLREAALGEIRSILYVAPFRHDLPSPYDPAEYQSWKQEIKALAETHGCTLLDLGALVPDGQWGPRSENADFNHFKAGGHELLAKALLPAVAAVSRIR